ncbi:MAG: nitroreductase family protein [Dysgonamonadaceae bacterium]
MVKILKKLLGPINRRFKLKSQIELAYNYWIDFLLYRKYSIAFHVEDLKNKEAELILNYHGIEKGFLHNNIKAGFAKDRIIKLHRLLSDSEIIENINRSQIRVAFQVMCEYFELQKKYGYNISNFYTEAQYNSYRSTLDSLYNENESGVIEWTDSEFYSRVDSNFESFAFSRKSIRNFTGEKIPDNILSSAIQLANTAPSVCNRQASNVYLVENKSKIDKILNIQGGFKGYTANVNQLLILTNDRRYYYTNGERNQLYIDGGIYLMNLLYALHFNKIANCPIHWGKTIQQEKALNGIIAIPEAEKVICMIPIGISQKEFKTTLSLRRNFFENFFKL